MCSDRLARPADLLVSREREISELKAKVTEVLAVMPTMNEASQLGHNMSISDLGSCSLSSYLSTYPLSMSDLGLSGNMTLSDLSGLADHGPSSIALTPSSPLTPMRPYTSKLFSHANGSLVANGLVDSGDKSCKAGSSLDPNATAYTPKTLGNGEL